MSFDRVLGLLRRAQDELMSTPAHGSTCRHAKDAALAHITDACTALRKATEAEQESER